jgi:hypothetical protein
VLDVSVEVSEAHSRVILLPRSTLHHLRLSLTVPNPLGSDHQLVDFARSDRRSGGTGGRIVGSDVVLIVDKLRKMRWKRKRKRRRKEEKSDADGTLRQPGDPKRRERFRCLRCT